MTGAMVSDRSTASAWAEKKYTCEYSIHLQTARTETFQVKDLVK